MNIFHQSLNPVLTYAWSHGRQRVDTLWRLWHKNTELSSYLNRIYWFCLFRAGTVFLHGSESHSSSAPGTQTHYSTLSGRFLLQDLKPEWKKQITFECLIRNTVIFIRENTMEIPPQLLSPCSTSGCQLTAQTSISSTRGQQETNQRGCLKNPVNKNPLNEQNLSSAKLFTCSFSFSLTIQPFLKFNRSGCQEDTM